MLVQSAVLSSPIPALKSTRMSPADLKNQSMSSLPVSLLATDKSFFTVVLLN